MVTNLQMELEGTGVRASIVHPGPTLTKGLDVAAVGRTSRPNAGGSSKAGQARHNYFLRPSDLARYRVRRKRRAGVSGEHGDSTGGPVEGCARAPSEASTGRRGDAGLMSAVALPRVSWLRRTRSPREFRTDPIGLMQRVRDAMRGRRYLPGWKRSLLLNRPARQRILLPGGRRDLTRPCIPVHDADLRRGRGVRRQPGTA